MTEAYLKQQAKEEAERLIQQFTKKGLEEHAKHFSIVCCTEIMESAIRGGHVYNHYERVRREIESKN